MNTFIYWLYIKLQEMTSNSSLIIRAYKRAAEKVLRVYFITNPIKPKLSPNDGDSSTIVSLTTFPARINNVWLVIESILHQSQKPNKIILWLYEGDFESKASLPKRLLNLEKRGLEIRFCDENLMPHIKYYYTMREYSSSNIITVDDDLLYPPNLIETFLIEHHKYPDAILCPVSRKIRLENNMIGEYINWSIVTENSTPGYIYLMMGVGGAFYPANSLHEEVFNLKNIKQISLKADDLWLKVMSLLKGSKVRSLAGDFPYTYLPVSSKKTRTLGEINIDSGNNDRVFKSLLEKYEIDLNNYIIDK